MRGGISLRDLAVKPLPGEEGLSFWVFFSACRLFSSATTTDFVGSSCVLCDSRESNALDGLGFERKLEKGAQMCRIFGRNFAITEDGLRAWLIFGECC